ncbi:MAG: hypothetical protein INQ03_07860 [Candidatus Heimdallarchaeota archaeon]|nr:hypothetical protein [Candidatus Heimdallarchaeota archaeon]
MTTIQISDSLKEELTSIKHQLQLEEETQITYEQVIRRLIDDYQFKIDSRKAHSRSYSTILEAKYGMYVLREGRRS